MWCRAAGPRRVPVARRDTWTASAAAQETRAWGVLHIPQRLHICTDRCSRANLRTKGGFPRANLRVRTKKQKEKFIPFCFLPILPMTSLHVFVELLGGCLFLFPAFTLSTFLWLCVPPTQIIANADDASNQQTFCSTSDTNLIYLII